jgi:hypothetical protein
LLLLFGKSVHQATTLKALIAFCRSDHIRMKNGLR